MECGGGVGRGHLGLVGRPKPAVDVFGEELSAVAAVKVAEPARGPVVLDAVGEALQPLVLLSGVGKNG